MKRNKGIALIELILFVLTIALLFFLLYEIFYMDVLGIMTDTENPLEVVETGISNTNTVQEEETDVETNETENLEAFSPLLNTIEYSETEEVTETTNNYYYYNQLDDTGKTIYEALESNIENMKSGNYTIDFGTEFNSLLKSNGGEETLNIAYQSAWNAFSYDYPGLFYLDITKMVLTTKTTTIAGYSTHRVTLSCGDSDTYFTDGITSEEDAESKIAYVENIRSQIVDALQGYTEYEQIKYVHNWLIDNIEYDTNYSGANNHDIYGAFADGTVVCEGYARAFKYIMDGLGIDCVLISGTATNSKGTLESHAWNYVELNGSWYAIDVTWDDPILSGTGQLTNALRYKYFLKGSNSFFTNHIEDGYLSDGSIEFSFPTLSETDYSS